MGKWIHRTIKVDTKKRMGLCSNCGWTRMRRGTKSILGWRCCIGQAKWAGNKRKGYQLLRNKYLKKSCERCGFIPENEIQLELHHKDGNRKNNNLNNLQTICANCHKLYTFGRVMLESFN